MNAVEFHKTVKAEYAELGKKPILTMSRLRFELPMEATTTKYEFPTQVGVNSDMWNVRKTEFRQNPNDNFHIRRIGFFTAVTTAATDANFRLRTYPNEIEYTAAVAADVMNAYNANLSLNVNSTDVMTGYGMERHYFVPQTQRLSVAAAQNRDQVNLEVDGWVELDPPLMLGGQYTNTLVLNLLSPIANVPAAQNGRLIFILDGLKAANAAERIAK